MICPDCGVDITVPSEPGWASPCNCNPGWYRMGALVEDGDGE